MKRSAGPGSWGTFYCKCSHTFGVEGGLYFGVRGKEGNQAVRRGPSQQAVLVISTCPLALGLMLWSQGTARALSLPGTSLRLCTSCRVSDSPTLYGWVEEIFPPPHITVLTCRNQSIPLTASVGDDRMSLACWVHSHELNVFCFLILIEHVALSVVLLRGMIIRIILTLIWFSWIVWPFFFSPGNSLVDNFDSIFCNLYFLNAASWHETAYCGWLVSDSQGAGVSFFSSSSGDISSHLETLCWRLN